MPMAAADTNRRGARLRRLSSSGCIGILVDVLTLAYPHVKGDESIFTFPPNLWDLLLLQVFGEKAAHIDSPEERQRLLVCAGDEGLLPLMFWANDVPEPI